MVSILPLRMPRWIRRLVVVPLIRLVALIAVLFFLGFLSRSYTPLGSRYKPLGRQVKNALNLDDPVPFSRLQLSNPAIGLSCSGGGSRAAYFTAAVLSEIQRYQEKTKSDPESNDNLLGRINVISSVSGGSLAAAYFALNHKTLVASRSNSPAWQDYLNNMAVSYRRREWSPRAILPTAWFKLLFTNYNRGLMARDDYDKTLFHQKTIGDLPEQPALYINSFDVANHVRFIFSKTYIDTSYFQPMGWWGKLSAPQDLTTENDLAFCSVDPGSVKIADAVYASSAFPVAYPNVALNHFGSKILFQGRLIFLADGGLADNSGLMTLFTQIKAGMEKAKKSSPLLVIYIDATIDRITTNGSKFQQQGVEDRYAWHDTIIGHGIESIDSGNALLQDLVWKFLENNGIVTDQLNQNWPVDLRKKSTSSPDPSKTSWEQLFESAEPALRPCIIRLGLRDVANPDFPKHRLDAQDSRLQRLLAVNGISTLGQYEPAPGLPERLQGIKTDFALSEADRRALDLAAYLLVNGKLADDLAQWSNVIETAIKEKNATP